MGSRPSGLSLGGWYTTVDLDHSIAQVAAVGCSDQGIQGLYLNAFSGQSTSHEKIILSPVSWSKHSQPL